MGAGPGRVCAEGGRVVIPVCRSCCAGAHCGGQPLRVPAGYVRCECVVCEWAAASAGAVVTARLLDLFCGAGGAAVGYARAGFKVTGVDIDPQPHYPFEFHQADAMTYPLDGFDVVHASPPCQAYTTANARYRGLGGTADSHPRLLEETCARLAASGAVYVVENVVGAARAFKPTLRLTGGMFGLRVWRPRLFESNVLILSEPSGKPRGQVIGVYGDRPDGRYLNSRTKGTMRSRAAASIEEASAAMGIDWMTWDELREAIPPAYTQFIGEQLLAHLGVAA